MIRGLALAGLIAIAFGVGATFIADSFGLFNQLNFALGVAALAAAAILALRGRRGAIAPSFRIPLLRGIARIALAIAVAVGLEAAASALLSPVDWSFEGKFAPAEATVTALEALCPVDATLYFDEGDPRIRSTRLLLGTLGEATGCLAFDEREIDAHPDDEDRYAIGSSNTVVLRLGGPDGTGRAERSETVERPTEGTLYEALFRLRQLEGGILYVARGAGEGDIENTGDTGFSGLAVALQTEGFQLHQFVGAALEEIPDEAAAVVWIAPQRQLPPEALAALTRYLEGGGRLVAFLEPGVESGLESVLAEFGITATEGIVIDPASTAVDGESRGFQPLVYNYDTRHPVSRGLGAGRMTYFIGARSFDLRKPQPEDRLEAVAFASPRSWIATDPDVVKSQVTPTQPADARTDYHPLVVTGLFPRAGGEARIVAFGDAQLASNHYLRTLYNLDVVLNAVHWATTRESEITLRPKTGVGGRWQFPLPIENTLTMFQSLGLLLPELLLIAAAALWVRTRS
jgi:hypothetical protein